MAQALQKKGEQLVSLGHAELAELALPEELKAAVAEARKITRHEARRRQLQYIGRLMREIDTDAVDAALQQIASREADKRRRFRMVEGWRDELVAGNDDRWRWLVEQYPQIDRHELERLILGVRGPSPHHNPKNAARQLFRFLVQLDAEADLERFENHS